MKLLKGLLFCVLSLAGLPAFAQGPPADCTSYGFCAGLGAPTAACKPGQIYTQIDAAGKLYACNGIPPVWHPASGSGASAAGLGQAQYSGAAANLLASPQEFYETGVPAGTTTDMSATVQASLAKIGCRIYNGAIGSAVYHLPAGMPQGIKIANVFVPSGVIVEPPGGGPLYGTDAIINDAPLNVISDLELTNGGTGYTHATVTIGPSTDNYGSGATATATVSGGAVSALTLTNAGNYYFPNASCTITGDGTGATCSATSLGPLNGEPTLRPDFSYVADCPEFNETAVPLGGNNVTIRGYSLQGNSGNAGGQDIGIRTYGEHDMVENVTVSTFGGSGIYLGGQDNQIRDSYGQNLLMYSRQAPPGVITSFIGGFDLESLDSRLFGGEVSTGSMFALGGRTPNAFPHDCAVVVNGGGAEVGEVLAQVSDINYCVVSTNSRIHDNRGDFSADVDFYSVIGGNTFIDNFAQGPCVEGALAYGGNCAVFNDSGTGGSAWIGNHVDLEPSFGANYITASFFEATLNSWYGNTTELYPAINDTSGNNLVYQSSYTENISGGGGPGMHPVERTCVVPAGLVAPNLNACTTVIFQNTTPTYMVSSYYAPMTDMKFFGSANDIIESGGGTVYGISNYAPCANYPLALSSNGIHFQSYGQTLIADCPPAVTGSSNVNGIGYTSPGTIAQIHGDLALSKIPTPGAPALTATSITGSGTTTYRWAYTYGKHSVVSSADASTSGFPGAGSSIAGQSQPGWTSGILYRETNVAGYTSGIICTNTFPTDSPCAETGQTATTSAEPALGFNDTGAISSPTFTPVSGHCPVAGDVRDSNTNHYRCNDSNVWTVLNADGTYHTL